MKVLFTLAAIMLLTGEVFAAGTTIHVLFPDRGFEGGTVNQVTPGGFGTFPPTGDGIWRLEPQIYTNTSLLGSGITPHGGSMMMAYNGLGSGGNNADMWIMVDLRAPLTQALINTGNAEFHFGAYFNRVADSVAQAFFSKDSARHPFFSIRFFDGAPVNINDFLYSENYNDPTLLPIIPPIPSEQWSLIDFIGGANVPVGSEFVMLRAAMHEVQPTQTVRGTYVDDVFLTLFSTSDVLGSAEVTPEPTAAVLGLMGVAVLAMRRRSVKS